MSLPAAAVNAALGLGTLGFALCSYLALRNWRTARLLSSTPPTAISALGPGLHEVSGAARGEGQVVSPLSGRPSLYWRFVIEQRRQNRWETLVDKKGAVPVFLDDGGGRLAIDLESAEVILTRDEHATGGIFGVPSAELTRVLETLEEAPPNLQGPYVRYREERFGEGDRLHGVGTVVQGAEGWMLRAEGDVHVLSDRDEGEVVRYEERLALRWAGVAIVGLGLASWGGLQLLG